MLEKKFLLGVGITDVTEEEILEYILQSLKKAAEKYYIVTPNPEILVYASKYKGFRTILNNARLALCDGIGIFWAGKFLGKIFKQRITGVDLLENLCKAASKQPITVGFLGGGPKIAERTAECLVSKYPGLKVAFIGSEWSEEGFNFSNKYHVSSSKYYAEKNNIHNTKYILHNTVDILFVAFGFPKQEEWMARNIGKVPVRIMVGVGGAFDYVSGNVPRAPVFVRSLGLEWLYRLLVQPWRLKRQIALLEFMYLVLKEKITVML